jgi:hypothetical protein
MKKIIIYSFPGKLSAFSNSDNSNMQSPNKLVRRYSSNKKQTSPVKTQTQDSITKQFFGDEIKNDFGSPAHKLFRRFSTSPVTMLAQMQELIPWKKGLPKEKKDPPVKYLYFLMGNYFGTSRDPSLIDRLLPCPPSFFSESDDDILSKKEQFGSDFISETDDFSMTCIDILATALKDALDNYCFLPTKEMIRFSSKNFINIFYSIFQPHGSVVFDHLIRVIACQIKK